MSGIPSHQRHLMVQCRGGDPKIVVADGQPGSSKQARKLASAPCDVGIEVEHCVELQGGAAGGFLVRFKSLGKLSHRDQADARHVARMGLQERACRTGTFPAELPLQMNYERGVVNHAFAQRDTDRRGRASAASKRSSAASSSNVPAFARRAM